MTTNPYSPPMTTNPQRDNTFECLALSVILLFTMMGILATKLLGLTFVSADVYYPARMMMDYTMLGLCLAMVVHTIFCLFTIGHCDGKSSSPEA